MEGLEDAHVEDIVYVGVLRQRQAVRDVAHSFQHLKGPGVSRTELAAPARDQGLCRAMEQSEQNPITHVERQSAMVCVVVPLGVVLSLEKKFPDVGEEGVPILQEAIHRRRARRGRLVGK